MTKENKTCPVCGSDDVRTEVESRAIAAQLGSSVAYDAVVDHCGACGESGDFEAVNDSRIEVALRESEIASVKRMLDNLASQGISNASLERALRLPQRTTSRWKEGKLSAGAAALLRAISVYPWLVEVADSGYRRDIAAFSVIREAGRLIAGAVASEALTYSALPVSVNTEFRISIGLAWQATVPVDGTSWARRIESAPTAMILAASSEAGIPNENH